MTKFEKKHKEITIIEKMHEAITDAMRWDCMTYEYNEETERHEWRENQDTDPELIEFYNYWLGKIEKML